MNQILVKTVALSEIQQNISWDLKYRIEQIDKAIEENKIAMEGCENSEIYESYTFNYEKYKIECGEKHFEALDKKIDFQVASDYNEFIENIDYADEDDDW